MRIRHFCFACGALGVTKTHVHTTAELLCANTRYLRWDEALTERLSQYLLVAFEHLETHELAHLPADVDPPESGKALGLCRGLDARQLFYAAIERIIVPGLSQHGLKAQWAWDNRMTVR